MNNGEHARWNRTLVNAYWIWTLCSFVISMLGVLNDFNCVWWGPGHLEKWGDKAHAQYISRSANNINRHLTRNSCRALSWKAGHLEPSGLGAKEIALFPPPALETFIRICEIARIWEGSETKSLVLSEHRVPADSESLLTLCKVTHSYLCYSQTERKLEHSGGINREEIQIRFDQRKEKPQTAAWE